MATTSLSTAHDPGAVFAVLENGWRYAEWVVGCKRIRDVDPSWPEPGSRFHHTVGVGLLSLNDSTEATAVEAPVRLALEARAWPAGRARVTITIAERTGGSVITMDEVPTGGPAKTLDNPLLHALIHIRNLKALRRLDRAVDRSESD